MRYMRRIFAMLLAVGMLTMTACGAAGDAPETTTAAASCTALQTESVAETTVAEESETAVERPPIRAILYRMPPDTVYYFTETEILIAKFPGEEIDLSDPMATEGVTVTETRAQHQRATYESICALLRKPSEDLPAPELPGDGDQLMVKNGKSTVIVYYEDGTCSFLQAYGDEDMQYRMLFAALSSLLARKM